MAKKGGGKKTARKKVAAPKTPRQPRLPGQEDAVIEAIEAAAEEYVSVRDRRMALTQEEIEAKADVQAAMHAAGKKVYTRKTQAGVLTVRLIDADEDVKVKLKKPKADDENPEE